MFRECLFLVKDVCYVTQYNWNRVCNSESFVCFHKFTSYSSQYKWCEIENGEVYEEVWFYFLLMFSLLCDHISSEAAAHAVKE